MNGALREVERIRRVAAALREAEKPVRILRSLAWPAAVRERFLATAGEELPEVSYPRFDPAPTFAATAEARRLMGGDEVVDAWFARVADAVEHGARMLAAVGTPAFFVHSRALYSAPRDPLPDHVTDALGLARQLEEVVAGLGRLDVGAPYPACHLADAVAEQIRAAVGAAFGDMAPQVVVVDNLSSNAIAGPNAIRLRRTACFTDRDVYQLIHHEAFIHVATSLNGREQKDLPILGAAHPGTTRTQEGLAVFAEFISSSMDLDRLRRLADRTLAIQQAIDGADFLEVYHFFLHRDLEPEQAFENARRVFRGGVLTGGAPFTKDAVYLSGLLSVHNFLRTAVVAGRSDCLRLLFCGKLDVEDLPALCRLATLGLCRLPRFLPPWAQDLRFLLAYLTYSAFLNRVNLEKIRAHYATLLAQAPTVPSIGGDGRP